MGQRLVIDIVSNNEDVAKVYFHWGAYSTTSMEEIRKLVNIIEKMPVEDTFMSIDGEKITFKNVKIIQEDGALHIVTYRPDDGMYVLDKKYAIPLPSIDDDVLRLIYCLAPFGGGLDEEDIGEAKRRWPGIDVPVAKNRNCGIVSISEKTMSESEEAAEEKAAIYVDTKEVSNHCFYEVGDPDGAEIIDSPYDFECIPFGKVDEVCEWLNGINPAALIAVEHGECGYLEMIA